MRYTLLIFISFFFLISSFAQSDTARLDKLPLNKNATTALLINADLKSFDYKLLQDLPNVKTLTVIASRNLDITKFLDNAKAIKQLKSLNIIGCGLGILPNAIGKLTQLESLSLRENVLRSLPDSIIRLSNLRKLDVSVNSYLYDNEVFSRLQFMNVAELDFSSSALITIEPSIGKVNSLRKVNFANNGLSTLPESMLSLKIEDLDLSENIKLDSTLLLKQLSKITSLTKLNLSRCELSALHSSIGELKNLEYLNLSGNTLKSIPTTFTQLKNLTYLNLGMEGISLRMNQIESLPADFGSLSRLEYLDLSGNLLTTLPASFEKLTALKHLDIHFAKLLDFPAQLCALTQLRYLNLNGNSLINLPENIGNLSFLEELRLDNNFFNRFDKKIKSIPASIGKLSNLRVLTLRDNVIETIPNTFSSLKKLELLDLRDNLLSTLPAEICQLKSLTYIDVKANEIKNLPPCLADLKSLKDLYLSFNTGLPFEQVNTIINQLTNLKFLDVSYNNFTKDQLTPFLSARPDCRVVNLNKKGAPIENSDKQNGDMYKFEKPVDR